MAQQILPNPSAQIPGIYALPAEVQRAIMEAEKRKAEEAKVKRPTAHHMAKVIKL